MSLIKILKIKNVNVFIMFNGLATTTLKEEEEEEKKKRRISCIQTS